MNTDAISTAQHAMSLVNTLCDAVGAYHFEPGDPDSPFGWGEKMFLSSRTGSYQKVAEWLLRDGGNSEEKVWAAQQVVNNLCAQLQRVTSRNYAKRTAEAEGLDMSLNWEAVFYASEQLLIARDNLVHVAPTLVSKPIKKQI